MVSALCWLWMWSGACCGIVKEYTIQLFIKGVVNQVKNVLKKLLTPDQSESVRRQLGRFPGRLLAAMVDTAACLDQELYLVGGALRDCLSGTAPVDLDFTIGSGSLKYLRQLRERYGIGTVVELGLRHDDTCRLVLPELTLDVSGFRQGSATIGEDLEKRDFTINAMAVSLQELIGSVSPPLLIDPLDGLADLAAGLLRACPGCFSEDPLRLVRAFRFRAALGYDLEPRTRDDIKARVNLVNLAAPERIRHELDLIMATGRAAPVFEELREVGLMSWLAPELAEGGGVEQPACHHLDVLCHNLETLRLVEQLHLDPERFFSGPVAGVAEYLADPERLLVLKWAGLFHDAGKPATKSESPGQTGRPTFYGHDRVGVTKFREFASRLRWSRTRTDRVARLIEMHMHPFHLCNLLLSGGNVSDRAKLKLCRRAGGDLPGLFILAMADSLAGQGSGKPKGLEEMLGGLYRELDELYRKTVEPARSGPRLLTGHDLIATVGLTPGPLFREILDRLELAVLEGTVQTRPEALAWVSRYLAKRGLPAVPAHGSTAAD